MTSNEAVPRHATTGPPSRAALLITGRQLLVALRFLLAMTVVLGIVYPRWFSASGSCVAVHTANGSLVPDEHRHGGRLQSDRAAIRRLPGPANGSRAAIGRRRRLRRDVLRADPTSPRNRRSCSQLVTERRAEIAAANGVDPADVPRGCPHRLRVRTRPGHQPGLRPAPGRPGRRGSRGGRVEVVRDLVNSLHPRAHPGLHRRGAGQRAGAESALSRALEQPGRRRGCAGG